MIIIIDIIYGQQAQNIGFSLQLYTHTTFSAYTCTCNSNIHLLQAIAERDLKDETMSHGETNSDAKDEQHSAKVYSGKLILHKLAEYYMPQPYGTVSHGTVCLFYLHQLDALDTKQPSSSQSKEPSTANSTGKCKIYMYQIPRQNGNTVMRL